MGFAQYNIRQLGEAQLPTVERLYYVSQSQDGKYWIGGNQGITVFDGSVANQLSIQDSSRLVETDQKLQSPVFEDKRGDLWFSTHNSLIHYRPDYNSFHVRRLSLAGEEAMEDYRVFHLDQSKDNAYLQAGPNLWLYDLTENKYELLGGPALGVDYKISPNKKVIIGSSWSQQLEIFRKDAQRSSFERTTLSLPFRVITSQFHQSDTLVYLGTSAGLAELTIRPDTAFFRILFPAQSIRSLVVDNVKSELWFTLPGEGLARYDIRNEEVSLKIGIQEGLSGASPRYVYLDNDNNVWLFHANEGLDLISPSSSFIQQVSPDSPSDFSDLIMSATGVTHALTNDGNFLSASTSLSGKTSWSSEAVYTKGKIIEKGKFCSFQDELLILANTHIARQLPKEQAWELFRKPRNSFNRSFPGKMQHPVYSTNKGMVTFSFSGDSVKQQIQPVFPTSEIQSYPVIFPLTDTTFLLIYKGAQVWSCLYQEGKYSIEDRQSIDFELRCAVPASDGSMVYLGTSRGLFGLTKGGLTKLFENEGALKHLIIESITIDSAGSIWCGTQLGLLCFNPKTGKKSIYGKKDGLPLGSFSNIQPIHQEDASIWMAVKNKIIAFDPTKSATNISVTVTPYINGVWVNDLPLSGHELHIARTKLRLPNSQNTLAFNLACISPEDDPTIEVEYQLFAYDKNPIRAARNTTIRYPNLPPGDYTLQLTAINRNGLPSGKKSLKITINPPYWQTWWFRSAAILVLALIAASIYILGLRRERLKQNRLQEQQARLAAERDRIAGEVHDDLGGQISSILYLSEEMLLTGDTPEYEYELSRINELSRNSLQNVRDIIFALDNRRATLSALGDQLTGAGEVFFGDRKISFRTTDELQQPEFMLTSRQKRNLTLIVKEAWHNTAKYAQATAVTLNLQEVNNQLVISLVDNGVGFTTTTPKDGMSGYGLDNMREKAKAIGGKLTIESSPGQGTSIYMTWPLPKNDN